MKAFKVHKTICAVESESRILMIAEEANKQEASYLRGEIFKPRPSSYPCHGLVIKEMVLLKRGMSANQDEFCLQQSISWEGNKSV